MRKILSDKLFPMRAQVYYAVLTDQGNKEDPIATIKQYEEHFFSTSKLFKPVFNNSLPQILTRFFLCFIAEKA